MLGAHGGPRPLQAVQLHGRLPVLRRPHEEVRRVQVRRTLQQLLAFSPLCTTAIFKIITFPILERSPISEIVPYNVCCGGKLTNKDVRPANNASRRAGAAAAGAGAGGDLSAAMAALHVGGHGGGASAASASTGSANEITLFIYQKHQCVQ